MESVARGTAGNGNIILLDCKYMSESKYSSSSRSVEQVTTIAMELRVAASKGTSLESELSVSRSCEGVGGTFVQGVPWELKNSIGLLHRPGSIPGPFIMWL